MPEVTHGSWSRGQVTFILLAICVTLPKELQGGLTVYVSLCVCARVIILQDPTDNISHFRVLFISPLWSREQRKKTK